MQISSLNSTVIIPEKLETSLNDIIREQFANKKIFITVDENTEQYCLPILKKTKGLSDALIIKTKSGEENKSVETLISIWDFYRKIKLTVILY